MFSRKKSVPVKRRNHDLSQFGLTEIPDDFDPSGGNGDDVDNDSDLEAELAAIAGGGGKRPIRNFQSKKQVNTDLDKMVADSLKDIGSEDEDDADLENDTDLLGELHNIVGIEGNGDESVDAEAVDQPSDGSIVTQQEEQPTILATTSVDTISLIQQRIEMYKLAEVNAKTAGENAKARRFGRGLKTLLELQKQAKSGKEVNENDIPPEVSVKPQAEQVEDQTPNVPSRSAPPPPKLTPPTDETTSLSPTDETTSPINSESSKPTSSVLLQMEERQRQYKAAALQAKRNGETSTAIQFLKVVKQFDLVIQMVEKGEEVDLSDMPPTPDKFMDFLSKLQGNAEEAGKGAAAEPAPIETPESVPIQEDASAPLSMLEALEQRLEKYKSVEESAKTEGNSSKARRFARIVKQYEDAIKQYKVGRPVPYDELPVPPGFDPLPIMNTTPVNPSAKKTTPIPKRSDPPTNESISSQGSSESTPVPITSQSPPQKTDLTTRTSGNQQKNNLAEQQMKILIDRQKEFKVAAIEAKKAGEIDQAKEYLKIYKGFDALLNAASSGLPVDLSTLPLPPSQRDNLEASFAIVTTEECDPDDDISDIGVRVEEQLAKQLMMCKNTRDHHKAMGDVAGMNRFENLALTVQKDLDLVRYSKRKNLSLPKFHYERRSFNIVHCNTELTDNELEIVIVRGLNYNVPNPKDVDTYVKLEFPLLNDETFKAKTSVIKNTESPDYDQQFRVEIQRGNRQFQRIFKRHGVKFEVLSRGCSLDYCGLSRILPTCCFSGFLRSDTLIGTVNVKLQPLETKCDIHDTFNLMDGRKAVGGKLEIKLRVRNPIFTKQVEHVEEKWLVLDA
ncbi:coiled-coil and C2 domain-containing protein 1-like isoform X1 [Anastrepha obliqua]|uniref:coiled-coil and C2 domain-containing protein 1-like isoform X1 n=1 Tax=Anastrepha obliqua TaxID=95512 RepID=UPI0024094D13|nr:coiled-coil and C2 domain-containing protein 1-like isoform X1 [Anastrepha obliqua]XP_054741814.1 coiled-coil and C2 domain-containing protein 1-like isoform X1 [Anastrepha obliqua]